MDLTRRRFLNAMLGAGALSGFGGATSLFPSAARAAGPTFGDYKALIVLFLHGGNDAFNTVVPLGSESGRDHATYRSSRGAMAIGDTDLNPGGGHTDLGGNPYAEDSLPDAYRKGVYPFGDFGINAMMPELAQLFQEQSAAAVANVGTLVEPVTKATLRSARLPPFLFAHNHQQRAMETGWADNLASGGWAGRLADLWEVHDGSVNGGSPLGLNVSYGGATRMMTADHNSPVVLSPGRAELVRANRGFDAALFKSLNAATADDHPLHRVLKAANRKTSDLSDILALMDPAVYQNAGLLDPYGNPLFSEPSASQLQMPERLRGQALRAAEGAALMVKFGRDLGLARQVVYFSMGGYDNHSGLLTDHPLLLRELSLAIWSLQRAIESVDGLAEQVVLCTMSDFGRTLGNNGDGTDHAWAGHNLVVGHPVNGGSMVGAMPDLVLGGDQDSSRGGRVIPDIAVDQYLATLCSWFGVEDVDMSTVFPNLPNFRPSAADPISSAYLDGLIATGS